MQHPTDRIIHTTAFVTPVVEYWLEREIDQWGLHLLNIHIHNTASPCFIIERQSLKCHSIQFNISHLILGTKTLLGTTVISGMPHLMSQGHVTSRLQLIMVLSSDTHNTSNSFPIRNLKKHYLALYKTDT